MMNIRVSFESKMLNLLQKSNIDCLHVHLGFLVNVVIYCTSF